MPAALGPGHASQEQRFTNIVTLVSAKEETLSDSEFAIPADYAEAGASPARNRTNAAAGLRDVLQQMEKKGLSEADRKRFEQIIKNSEAQQPKK